MEALSGHGALAVGAEGLVDLARPAAAKLDATRYGPKHSPPSIPFPASPRASPDRRSRRMAWAVRRALAETGLVQDEPACRISGLQTRSS